MAIIRWALLALMGFAFLLLAVSNWTFVPFILPDGGVARAPLPLLLAGAFLAGMIPTWGWMAFVRPLLEGRRLRPPARSDRAEVAEVAPPLTPG
ncbi:MAG: hypothetical protein KGQ52_02675 [Alphaproteobacteria bacterium]|nr:hypothetical protein [Alphaproteobacteria bacterium]